MGGETQVDVGVTVFVAVVVEVKVTHKATPYCVALC